MDKDIGETPKEHRFGCSLACNLPRRVASGQTISSLRPGQKKKSNKLKKKNQNPYYFVFLFPNTFSVHPVLLCCRQHQQCVNSEQQFGSIFTETPPPQTKIYIELNCVSVTYFTFSQETAKKA